MARRFFRYFLPGVLTGVCGLLIGCGGGGGGGGNPAVSVQVTPDSAQLAAAQATTFTATVSGTPNQEVNWSVLEGAAGGTITNTGVYTAPGLAGVYHVVATSRANLTKNASVPVTVHVALTVNPTTANLTLREARQFAATVIGAVNTGVSWSVQEGASGGAISAAGLYTAPAAPGTFHIVAVSQADPQQTGTITVTVVSGSASGTVE